MYTNYFDALCAVVLSNRERERVRFGVRVDYFESESMHESLTAQNTGGYITVYTDFSASI